MHVEALGKAQGGQRDHDATDFLRALTDRAAVHIVDQLVRLAGRAAARLDQLKRLFQEAVIALGAVSGDLGTEARHHPRLHAALE